jgi:cephalosporin hydroxylase
MKIVIDTDAATLACTDAEGSHSLDLYSREAFEVVARQYLRLGWNQKYTYTFSWLGRPIIQLPDDMVRLQEVIYRLRPDVIVETGVAHGGSLVFSAGLCQLMGQGRVIGVDIEIRKHNRAAIERHELSPLITLIEGDAVADDIVARVEAEVRGAKTVLVILDSCHTRAHVLAELRAYSRFVTPGSYIIATDGVMEDVYDAPRGNPSWKTDNPVTAVREFLQESADFSEEQPAWPFNESPLERNVTHWPRAWLLRQG